jgi:hypothetical protein
MAKAQNVVWNKIVLHIFHVHMLLVFSMVCFYAFEPSEVFPWYASSNILLHVDDSYVWTYNNIVEIYGNASSLNSLRIFVGNCLIMLVANKWKQKEFL